MVRKACTIAKALIGYFYALLRAKCFILDLINF